VLTHGVVDVRDPLQPVVIAGKFALRFRRGRPGSAGGDSPFQIQEERLEIERFMEVVGEEFEVEDIRAQVGPALVQERRDNVDEHVLPERAL